MAFDLSAFSRETGRVTVDDLDFDAFSLSPLHPDHLHCLRYAHDVEFHTSCFTRNLLNTRANLDPEISSFLTLWNFEEYWHGEALGRVLSAHGEPAGTERIGPLRQGLGWRLTVSPLAWMLFSAANPHFIAVHMTWGVINEWSTHAGYARLMEQADHPVLSELLRRVMRQEARHVNFYLEQARTRLAASPAARRATRMLLQRAWKPVGSSILPAEDTRRHVRTLFGDAVGHDVVAQIDRRIDRLPGLSGLGLMTDAVRRCG